MQIRAIHSARAMRSTFVRAARIRIIMPYMARSPRGPGSGPRLYIVSYPTSPPGRLYIHGTGSLPLTPPPFSILL